MRRAALLLLLVTSLATAGIVCEDIYVANSAGTLHVRHGATLDAKLSDGGYGHITDLSLRPDGNLVVVSDDGQVRLRDPQTLNGITADGGYGTGLQVVSLANNHVIVSNAQGTVRRRGTMFEDIVTDGGYGTVTDLALQSDGTLVANSPDLHFPQAHLEGAILRRDPVTLGGLTQDNGFAPNQVIAVQEGTDHIIVANEAGLLFLRDHITLQAVVPTDPNYGIVAAVASLSDGRIVVATDTGGGSIFIRQADNPKFGLASCGNLGDITALATQDDDDIIVGTSTGTLYRISDTGVIQAQDGGYGYITAIDVVPGVIPEPASLGLLGSGLLALVWRRKRR